MTLYPGYTLASLGAEDIRGLVVHLALIDPNAGEAP